MSSGSKSSGVDRNAPGFGVPAEASGLCTIGTGGIPGECAEALPRVDSRVLVSLSGSAATLCLFLVPDLLGGPEVQIVNALLGGNGPLKTGATEKCAADSSFAAGGTAATAVSGSRTKSRVGTGADFTVTTAVPWPAFFGTGDCAFAFGTALEDEAS